MFKNVRNRLVIDRRYKSLKAFSCIQILVAYKSMMDAEAWEAQLSPLPPQTAARLRERYPI